MSSNHLAVSPSNFTDIFVSEISNISILSSYLTQGCIFSLKSWHKQMIVWARISFNTQSLVFKIQHLITQFPFLIICLNFQRQILGFLSVPNICHNFKTQNIQCSVLNVKIKSRSVRLWRAVLIKILIHSVILILLEYSICIVDMMPHVHLKWWIKCHQKGTSFIQIILSQNIEFMYFWHALLSIICAATSAPSCAYAVCNTTTCVIWNRGVL